MISAEALAQTHGAAFAPEAGWTAADIQALLDRPGTLLIGDDRAFVLASAIADEAEILTIATHPAHRRTGLARGVLRDLASALPGVASLFLEVARDNAAAHALYISEGFAEVGCRKGYYRRAQGRSVDALILRKGLQSA